MRYVKRLLETQISRAMKSFPALVLTGPRRAGKTWLLRHLFPEASYFLLEDPDLLARVRSDPHEFLDSVETPAIIDEVQNAPELFAYVRTRIDRQPRRSGQWLLTGSQDAPLMRGVTESMAGRAAILHLMPFSVRETARVTQRTGGYPEVVAKPSNARLWFSSYLQTYLERDVRSITSIRDLATFRRFMAILASRHGQTLNKTDLATPLGVSVPTITQWLGILETTMQIIIVPPYHANFGKRLIKSPKVYIADSGMACHLLGIESAAELQRSPFRGVIFEGLIAAEIAKAQFNAGRRRELYYFRDEQGLEVDFLVPGPGSAIRLIECKASRTPKPSMVDPLLKLMAAMKRSLDQRLELYLVHESPRAGAATTAIAPGVRAMPWTEFLEVL